jgi:hypothetical protein
MNPRAPAPFQPSTRPSVSGRKDYALTDYPLTAVRGHHHSLFGLTQKDGWTVERERELGLLGRFIGREFTGRAIKRCLPLHISVCRRFRNLGLDNDVAIGAGVGVPLGVLLLTALIWALFERRKRLSVPLSFFASLLNVVFEFDVEFEPVSLKV